MRHDLPLVDEVIPEGRKWPLRLRELSGLLQSAGDGPSLDASRGEAWKILFSALSIFLRSHNARLGRVPKEDLEDLAAESALDLLRRMVSGVTDFSDRAPGEVASFLSKVARNCLLNYMDKDRRRVEPRREDGAEWDVGEMGEETTTGVTDAPDVQVERQEFTSALRSCAERLDPRSGLVWFFRVFYGMSSKDIATHPEVRLKVGHVDVLLQRARRLMGDCMRRLGFEPQDMPPGTFVELWEAFRLESFVARKT
jgi:RNA polymerase sigma factor (sigma-70 family)